MHRLRTCAARLRPITASQTARNLSQRRPPATLRTFQPSRRYTAPVAAEPFLNGTSSNYVEEMYYAWLENPKSVHKVRGPAAGVMINVHKLLRQSFLQEVNYYHLFFIKEIITLDCLKAYGRLQFPNHVTSN